MQHKIAAALVGLVLVAVALTAFVYSGLYNIAADEPHWRMTERVLALLRTRSIETRAADVSVPDLADPKRVLVGAGQYAEMCQACHLAPGIADTPLRQGLYPKPPELARHRMDPKESFWVIKHGIKMTGMPAWGASHGDDVLWSVVAFLQKLPELDAKQYRDLVTKAPADKEMQGNGQGADGHGGDAHSSMRKK